MATNFNGLLECKSVASTGATSTAFYARKDDSLISPVQIVNAEQTAGFSLVCMNNSICRISSTVGLLQLDGFSGVSDVYDTTYNPVAVVRNEWVSNQSYTGPSTSILTGPIELYGGQYMLQASVSLVDDDITTPVLGTYISAVFQPNPVIEDDPDFRFSAITIKPASLQLPSTGSATGACFTSGVFTVGATFITYGLGIEIVGAWNFGNTGNLTIQIVKVAGPPPLLG